MMAKKMNHRDLLASLAQDYYLSQLSLADLVEKYDLSRYLVNKYLEDARREGVVTINVAAPNPRNLEMETKFQELFDIENVHIISDSLNPIETSENVLNYAAHQITPLITQSRVVGLTWGSTVYNLIQNLPVSIQEDITFTQFLGENMKYKSDVGSMRMVELVASKFSAEYLTMAGPLYVLNEDVREGMKSEIAIKPSFDAAQHMDFLFTALGTVASLNSIPVWRENADAILSGINQEDIAGMVYGRPFDIDGNFLALDNDNVFGVNIDTIMSTPRRFAVVKSKFKTDALIGALRGKFFTDIVMTEAVARRVLTDIPNK